MKIIDLGEIQGDMVLFGGIYSNLAALDQLLDTIQRLKIPKQNCICTGDIVAYCADAEASVNRLRSFGCPVLVGNCEVQLAQNAQDCGCGFSEGSECLLLSRGWYSHAVDEVSDNNKRWMDTLPDRIFFQRGNQRYAVVHGAASDISRFIWPVTEDDVIRSEFKLLEQQAGKVDHVIAGHTGIPMQRDIDGKTWINTGAIGMPAHDGTSLTHYGLLIDNTLSIKDLKYDINATISTMKAVGLTQGYEKCLQTGCWPSEDNLPLEMRF